MRRLEDVVWEEGGRRTEQLFVVRSFSFPSQMFLTNVATSAAMLCFLTCLPQSTMGVCQRRRCINCTFAHANLKIVATQLTAAEVQQKTEAETNSAVHSVPALGKAG